MLFRFNFEKFQWPNIRRTLLELRWTLFALAAGWICSGQSRSFELIFTGKNVPFYFVLLERNHRTLYKDRINRVSNEIQPDIADCA